MRPAINAEASLTDKLFQVEAMRDSTPTKFVLNVVMAVYVLYPDKVAFTPVTSSAPYVGELTPKKTTLIELMEVFREAIDAPRDAGRPPSINGRVEDGTVKEAVTLRELTTGTRNFIMVLIDPASESKFPASSLPMIGNSKYPLEGVEETVPER